MKNNLKKINNVYWINISTREAYKDDADVFSFCHKLLLPQIEKAQIPAVDFAAFVASWNKVCPFTMQGEKWACFEQNSEIPLAIVERYSAEDYRIRAVYNQSWFDPYSVINMLRISEKPVPFTDGKRGCWEIDLIPSCGVGSETASLYVEYISHTICWTFDSCYSIEVGPMGHYEDYPFTLKEQHEESEFSSREQLIQCLVDFVPNRNSSKLKSESNAVHVSMDDVQLFELLSYYIAAPDKEVQNSSFPDKKPGKTEADCWKEYVEYYNKYYINWEKPYRQVVRHSEKIHLTRLENFIPIHKLADESISLDDFIFGIGKEMSKVGARINKEKNSNSNEYIRESYEYFTFFDYCLDDGSKYYSISPEEAAWFYLLLNKEQAAKMLDSCQLDKLNNLLASDYSAIEKCKDIPESCMAKLLLLRRVFADSDYSVYNWEYAINNAVCNEDGKNDIAALYAYHMGCSFETSLEEAEKVLNKTIDPKLKACYPGWEIEMARGKIYMHKEFKDLSLEDWLGFEHPFFKEHSKNPADSVRQYYKFHSSRWWSFPDKLNGYIDRIESYSSVNKMLETSDELVFWHDESYEYNNRYAAMLRFKFISDSTDDFFINTGCCEVPCKGWYDDNDRRYLVDPFGMTGLFEFSDTSLKYDELKKKALEEGLGEYCHIRFDELGGGYNSVCISRQNDTFTVNFCDEKGAPFSEHSGLPEAEACAMVYSYTEVEKRRKERKKTINTSDAATPANRDFSALGNGALKSEISSGNQSVCRDFISRGISSILRAMSLETILTILLISVLVLLVIIYRFLWRLLASEKLAGFALLGFVIAVIIALRFYFKKKRTKK